jgi:alkylated DNA repair dioxygenase AlkB
VRLADGGELVLFDPWLPPDEAACLFAEIRDTLPWRAETVTIAGRRILQPRLTAWIGDPGAAYAYSGLSLSPEPWTPALAALRARVEEAAGAPFNSVLANCYRSGDDSMGMHADKEKELGKDPVIASVSLGAARRFVMAYAGKQKGVGKVEIPLGGGSLLVMRGTTQHFWRHGVPKEPGAGPRINLTFRRILGVRTASAATR